MFILFPNFPKKLLRESAFLYEISFELYKSQNELFTKAFCNIANFRMIKAKVTWKNAGEKNNFHSYTFPSTCIPVMCSFAHIPKPNLFLSFTASIALISSAVRKFIPNSRTCIDHTENI